jgi:hypothetical protein
MRDGTPPDLACRKARPPPLPLLCPRPGPRPRSRFDDVLGACAGLGVVVFGSRATELPRAAPRAAGRLSGWAAPQALEPIIAAFPSFVGAIVCVSTCAAAAQPLKPLWTFEPAARGPDSIDPGRRGARRRAGRVGAASHGWAFSYSYQNASMTAPHIVHVPPMRAHSARP